MTRWGNRRLRLLLLGSLSVSLIYTLQLLGQVNVFHQGLPREDIHKDFNSMRGVKNDTSSPKGMERNDSEANVYRWKKGKWVRIPRFCSKPERFLSATLKTSIGNMKMYIHEIVDDVHVSGSIKRSGLWDSVGVYTMIARLKREPEMGLIDIGSQLGTFSLVAAMMGRHVVAVDPLVENVLRFCKTVESGNLTSKVTILFSAVSHKRKLVTFRRHQNNLGGTNILDVVKENADVDADNDYNKHYVHTVLLDDILPFVHFSKAFIKIDVEGHEYEALEEGRQLFADVKVQGILMEWFQIRTTKNGYKLKNALYDLGFRAEDPLRRGQLDQTKAMTWPNDILWMQKDFYSARRKEKTSSAGVLAFN